MPTNKFKMFAKLYSKDMHELIPEIVIVAVVALLLLFIRFKNLPAIVIGPAMMAFGLAVLLPVISSFKILGKEWSNNTVYLLMSLPVSGTMIIGSKLLALITQYIVMTIIAGLTGLFVVLNAVPELNQLIAYIPDYLYRLGLLYILSIGLLIYIISISFFSQIVGKISSRYSGFVTAGVFLATFYLLNKVISYLMLNLNWDMSINTPQEITAMFITSNLLICLVIAAIMLAFSIIIYNRRVEL